MLAISYPVSYFNMFFALFRSLLLNGGGEDEDEEE
jgi:hypothetical protein